MSAHSPSLSCRKVQALLSRLQEVNLVNCQCHCQSLNLSRCQFLSVNYHLRAELKMWSLYLAEAHCYIPVHQEYKLSVLRLVVATP